MTFVALALVVALIATVLVSAQLLARQQRAHARREDLLVNQILHLSGHTWTPPPSDEWKPPADGQPLVREYVTQPEQHPYV